MLCLSGFELYSRWVLLFGVRRFECISDIFSLTKSFASICQIGFLQKYTYSRWVPLKLSSIPGSSISCAVLRVSYRSKSRCIVVRWQTAPRHLSQEQKDCDLRKHPFLLTLRSRRNVPCRLERLWPVLHCARGGPPCSMLVTYVYHHAPTKLFPLFIGRSVVTQPSP